MKVLTFSRTFPAYHPKKGQPTYFVEKLWTSIGFPNAELVNQFIWPDRWLLQYFEPKHHTIRSGNRWKVGDKFSPRVWSGVPYQSKQIIIAPDIEIKKVWKFESKADGLFYLNGKVVDVTSCDIPKNDGLETDDFLSWFPVGKEFTGQIICWDENVNY